MLIVQLHIVTCKMISSTIDYRWHVQCFPLDLNRLLPFNTLDCFAIHFETILILFLCISGFRSPVYPEDSALAEGPIETFEQCHAYIKWFGVACSAIRSTNHYYQSIARLLIIHKIVQWPCRKVICHSQKYMMDHWVMPFDFTQSAL